MAMITPRQRSTTLPRSEENTLRSLAFSFPLSTQSRLYRKFILNARKVLIYFKNKLQIGNLKRQGSRQTLANRINYINITYKLTNYMKLGNKNKVNAISSKKVKRVCS